MAVRLRISCSRVVCVLAVFYVFGAASFAVAEEQIHVRDSSQLRKLWGEPPRQFSSGPLWVWNDRLTERQIVETLEDLAGQRVKQVWVHPRPGLMTPYLSDEWFALWKVALREADRLDMNIWIYDENSYPSGFAGGLVPEAMPESRGQGITLKAAATPPEFDESVLAVYRRDGPAFANVTAEIRDGRQLPAGEYLAATRQWARTGGWFGGKYYVDLLRPGVTEKFIEITFEAYRRELGPHLGARVPGIFTDEPHLQPAGGLHWTDDLPEQFQKRWGYDLVDVLPSLVQPVGDWRRVRHNYQQTLLDLFIERWAEPCFRWCEKNNVEFTGHYWEHGWPGASHGPDNMAMYAWHQRPAIDTLMNQYRDDTHAQFGNARAVKELSSVANQLGCNRTLCEAYGAGGWDLRFEDMKRIGDWLYVLGVNTLNEHLSYITIRGARKRDHPQSFSYHAPWWDDYHRMAAYFTRLSLAMSAGEQVNDVLLIEPTATAWMYQPDGERLGRIGHSFQSLVNALEAAQVEYDLGSEDIIARNGSVDRAALVVRNRRYTTVVLPPLCETLGAKTVELLDAYVRSGGVVLCCGLPPSLVDGRAATRVADLAQGASWQRVEADELPDRLAERADDGFAVLRADGDSGLLFHHRRRLDDGEILFLVNTSIDHPSAGSVVSRAGGAQRWEPATGRTSACRFTTVDAGIELPFELPPCGSLLLFLSKAPVDAAPDAAVTTRSIAAQSPPVIERIDANVLPLDYVDVTAGGKSLENTYFYRASQFAFAQNGLARNPWDSAVQFRDELITKTFPKESGFTAKYRFTIRGPVPEPLHVVVERPDLYRIRCNGRPVTAEAGRWWLDKSFGMIDVAATATEGENTLTIEASPMSVYHELEPAYVLGDFSLEATDAGFAITRPVPLALGRRDSHAIDPDGSMWLSAGVGFGESLGGRDAVDDGAPFVVLDLGEPCDLRGVRVWNYNEVNLTGRGTSRMKIIGSTTGKIDSFTIPLGTFELDRAESGKAGPSDHPRFPQTLDVDASTPSVRFVQLRPLANHNGVAFPTDDGSIDNAFVGLSEVELLAAGTDAEPTPVSGVKVHAVSSELGGSFDRRAGYLVDGSGRSAAGWNRQGCPFYAGAVAYTSTFDVPPSDASRYFVRLPAWHGSVARVFVGGQPAGHVAYRPWRCEVTGQIRPGKNTVRIEVVGTLKNTLGPHHNGPVRGSAWPGMFHKGPEPGPPPGDRYDTIGYGLFAPAVLERETIESP